MCKSIVSDALEISSNQCGTFINTKQINIKRQKNTNETEEEEEEVKDKNVMIIVLNNTKYVN